MFWLSMILPAALTLALNWIAGMNSTRGNYGIDFLWVPLVMLFVIAGCAPFFRRDVGRRYRKASLMWLVIAYLLGQMIVCLTVWLGSCQIFAN